MLVGIGAGEDRGINTRAIRGGDGAQLSISAFFNDAGQIWHLSLEDERTDNVQLHSIDTYDDDTRLSLGGTLSLSKQRNRQQKKGHPYHGIFSDNHRTPVGSESASI